MRKITKKINKNYLIQKKFKLNELSRICTKTFIKEFGHLEALYLYVASLSYKSGMYYSEFSLRCSLSGRARATIKKFMLSRMMLKKLGLNGFITGLKKAS